MTSATTQRFASKVDWWLAVIVASVPLISAGTAVAGTLSGDMGAAVIGGVTTAVVVALYATMLWPVEYVISGGELVVRFGLLRQRLPLMQIARVQPSRNPLASPALSLDRIRIDRWGGGYLLVSPADRHGFVLAILEHAPGVEIDPRLGSSPSLR